MKTILCFVAVTVGGLCAAEGSLHHVVIEGMKFNPSLIEVKKGDQIRWENKDLVPHTVTAEKLFDSGSLDPGKTFQVKIRKSGEIEYICRFHPTMKASIRSR